MSFRDVGFQTERKDKRNKERFFGKYRAIVTNNRDTVDRMGRVKVKCPAVLGNSESNWCMPCLPFAGNNIGMAFIPNVGDSVWVEFEGGDPDKPIWVGNWWGVGEMPTTVYRKVGSHHMIKTAKISLHFDDEAGELYINGNVKVRGKITEV